MSTVSRSAPDPTSATSAGAGAAAGEGRQLLPRAERYASVLQGAARAFAESGYAATSMDDVAAAAGVTKLIVYRHFDSKEDLYRAILERVSDRLAEVYLAGARERDARPSTLGIRSLLAVAREDPHGFTLLFRHAAREAPFADYAEQRREAIVRGVESLVGEGDDPALRHWKAETLVSTVVAAVLHWLDAGDDQRDEQVVELAARAVRAAAESWRSPHT